MSDWHYSEIQIKVEGTSYGLGVLVQGLSSEGGQRCDKG